jgi:hypothetical protein
MSVGESVSEVDLEAAEGAGPVVGLAPFALGALDGEVDELGGGLFVGECPRVLMLFWIWRLRFAMLLVV